MECQYIFLLFDRMNEQNTISKTNRHRNQNKCMRKNHNREKGSKPIKKLGSYIMVRKRIARKSKIST